MNHFQGSPILKGGSDPSLLRAPMQWALTLARNPLQMERLLGVFLWTAFFAVLLTLGE